ncbi:hypothetical protein [Clostridium omnivorum]|uniref:Uncharacterized protein n=1 Tax=Clostridium omnivorum TaxID=1604902 RepID=A0ABQ5N4P1_9CLOT|nr:hypothetical protein [Clostridium sp. E14]GLC30176.1 hypothetical protein bsdE14_15860 [Clostridium sp. E14]
MRIHNKSIIVSFIIILFILLLCLPNIIDLIPSRKVKYVITVVFCLLVFLFLVYITYNDIRKREYTTTVYIVLLEIIGIIAYVIGSYTYFHKTGVSDIEVLLRRNNIQAACLFYILCESIVITFLKRDSFKKKQ